MKQLNYCPNKKPRKNCKFRGNKITKGIHQGKRRCWFGCWSNRTGNICYVHK